ncbi:MAG: glycosyltransferase family 2 protein [Rhizobiaceae bacterium]|nr:glycosyltransferase family 2 protein [Rhizobiaceae bacterium]
MSERGQDAGMKGLVDGRVSVVIPCKNEAANMAGLLDEIAASFAGLDTEIIVVDDGSTDDLAAALRTARARTGMTIRHLRHARSTGKSLALRTGVFAATGAIVVTIDGDGQNNPDYARELHDALAAAGPEVGIAIGQRLKREDGQAKIWASRFANGLRGRMLGDDTRDTACGLKALRTDIFRRLPFFEGSHRFLPALVRIEGYGLIHRDVIDRERVHGSSHYGILDRGLHGALDLIGMWWYRRRRRIRPDVTEPPVD